MKKIHTDIQKWVKKYPQGNNVNAETMNGPNNLLLTDGEVNHYYRPDIVCKKGKVISYVMEVESREVQKAWIGALIELDLAIEASGQKVKPVVIFVYVGKSGSPIKTAKNLNALLQLIHRARTKHIKEVKVLLEKDFKKYWKDVRN